VVDLGGFQQLRHGKAPQTEVSIGVQFNLMDDGRNIRDMRSETTFAEYVHPSSAGLPPETKPGIIRFVLREGDNVVLHTEHDEASRLRIKCLDVEWLRGFLSKQFSEIESPAMAKEFQELACDGVFNSETDLIPLHLHQDPQQSRSTEQRLAFYKLRECIVGRMGVPGLLAKCLARIQRGSDFSYLGPLRKYPERNLTVAKLPATSDPGGLFAWRLLYEDEELRCDVNQWLAQVSNCKIVTDNNVYAGPFCERLKGELHRLISLRKSERCKFQDWDDETDIQSAFDSTKATLESETTGVICLEDMRTGKQITNRDVGLGLSQVIPILALSRAVARGSSILPELVLIEQPELHVHPALQTELGDLFVEGAVQHGKTFLIETHSEHLILRLLRRIRETSRGKLPEGKQALRPEDICVLYVEPTKDGSIVREMPVNERGEFVKGWPGGFFEERLDELL